MEFSSGFLIINAKMKGHANLLEIVNAVDSSGGMLGLAERRQQKRSQNGDDGDHHQQLNQSEPPMATPCADELRFNDGHTPEYCAGFRPSPSKFSRNPLITRKVSAVFVIQRSYVVVVDRHGYIRPARIVAVNVGFTVAGIQMEV